MWTNRRILIGFLAAIFVIFLFRLRIKISKSEPVNDNAFIIVTSVTSYFEKRFYESEHTAAMLFLAPVGMSENQKWLCLSTNSTGHELVTPTHPRLAHEYQLLWGCALTPYVLDCETVASPSSISLTKPRSKNPPVELPFEVAVSKRYPVVGCVGSHHFIERWHQIALNIEMYTALGLNRLVHYWLSGHDSIHKLLKAYADDDVIDLRYWGFAEHRDINAKLEITMRDISSVFNDCIMKYRLSADFIFGVDLDDILIITNPDESYHEQFTRLFNQRPDTSWLLYETYPSYVHANRSSKEFDIGKTLESAVIGSYVPIHSMLGKIVINTSDIELTNVHYVWFYNKTKTKYVAEFSDGMVFHARFWDFDTSKSQYKFESQIKDFHPTTRHLTDIIPVKHIKKIQASYKKRLLGYMKKYPGLKYLAKEEKYYKLMDECVPNPTIDPKKTPDFYKMKQFTKNKEFVIEFVNHGQEERHRTCGTYYNCKVPKMEDFPCRETKREYERYDVDSKLAVFVPSGPTVTYLNTEGCTVPDPDVESCRICKEFQFRK